MPKEKILYIYEYPVSLLIYDPNYIPYNICIINILVKQFWNNNINKYANERLQRETYNYLNIFIVIFTVMD